MSIWLSEINDDTSITDLRNKGIQHKPTVKPPETGLFDGALTAVPRGVAAGAVKVFDTVKKPFERIADHVEYSIDDVASGGLDGGLDVSAPTFNDVHAQKNIDRRESLVSIVEDLQDKDNTGLVGSIGFGVSDFATRALLGSVAGGVVGATAVTGLSEGNYSFEELTEKGVDAGTAAKVAAVDAGVAAASTVLPLSFGFKGKGGIIKDAALSVGGATGLSVGGQAVSGQILENENYADQAKKYEITAESIATEVVLNGLLFGAGRYAQSRLNTEVDAELKSLDANQIEAENTAIQAALAVNETQYEVASAPVKTKDPIQFNNHLKNLDEAVANVRAGRPVNVVHSVKGDDKQREINYDAMALPANAKLIARKAQQEGIPPNVALTIAHIETGGKFSHTAQNPTSSAHGLFQVLDGTWKQFGGGDRNNVNEQIRIGFKHMKQAESHMRKSLNRELEPHEHYLGHLLGPHGASTVLKADPNASLIDVVRKYDAKNAEAIVKNNGMSGMTVGQAVDKWRGKWNQLSARYGTGDNISIAHGMDGSSYEVAYEVKSLDELIASNDAMYGINPLYPQELQPRDRTREASRQQIERMANDLKPDLLGESPKLSDGAPIIGMDNVVESGNGRTLAIAKAYADGKADEYRAYVEQYAAQRGWDVSGVSNPVLVRTRLSDTDRVQFARLANESDVAQFSSTERARSDADRLPDASLLQVNEDGTINLNGSMDFVRGFVGQLPKSEQATVMTGEGRLSQEGKRRIESAIMQRAYNDSNLISRMTESLDDDSKTVLSALLRVAPQLAQLDALVKQGGRHGNSIAKDLAEAAQKYSDIKASGQRVEDYLAQQQLIDDGLSQGAKEYLNVFEQNKRSAKGIIAEVQTQLDEIEAMGDPRQFSLFGDSPEEAAALNIILQNPNQEISVSRIRPDGEVEEITMTLRERLDELEAEAQQAQTDIFATETAISCALQFGE